MGTSCYCIMVSVCFDLMTGKVEHLLIHLLAIRLSFSVKCLFKSFAYFSINVSGYFVLIFRSVLCVPELRVCVF